MVVMMLMMAEVMTMTYIVTIFTIIDDFDFMTINLNHVYGNDIELNHLQDVEISKGVERGGDYDNDDKINDNGDVHIDLEGPSGS